MPARPLITFCIATYNRVGVVGDCLEKVFANGLGPSQFEVRIIDNASGDGTAELIERRFPQAFLTRLPKNCGPVAKNIAMRQARGEFLILLDDDAFPHPGATGQMVRHFRDNPRLGAAVFDVALPDGSKEASAYPDVFIGAGTGLRRSALEKIASAESGSPGGGGGIATLPGHFFMQAEEYDLSFRLLDAGYSIQRFWDLPLTHLKTPNARIGQRTTRLDVRNNLYLLAKYIPAPLCHQLAADWLARYWRMAAARDALDIPAGGRRGAKGPEHGSHKQAYLRGAAEGLAHWNRERAAERHLLHPETVERIFKFDTIRERMSRAIDRLSLRRVIFADVGKNMFAYVAAARSLGLEIVAIADEGIVYGGRDEEPTVDYRTIPIRRWSDIDCCSCGEGDGGGGGVAIIVTTMSRAHAPARAAALRRTLPLPVIDLFSRQDGILHGRQSSTTCAVRS